MTEMSVPSLPKIHLESTKLSNISEALQKEWIITNGLGGYASSTVLGVNTRKYHGLLVAALNPPVNRWVFLVGLNEEVKAGCESYQLGTNEFRWGMQPKGYQFLSSFSLNPFPTYTYTVNGVELRKTVYMPHQKNATIISYEIYNRRGNEATIHIAPLVNFRHFHSVTNKNEIDWVFIQDPSNRGVCIQPSTLALTLCLASTNGRYFTDGGKWIEGIYFRMEDLRGGSHLDDCFQPGRFRIDVAPKQQRKFRVIAVAGRDKHQARECLSFISQKVGDRDVLYERELERRIVLLKRFQRSYVGVKMEEWLKWLILAADSFIVHRRSTKTKSVIAGYHWFEDWGRDSLIALPGLTLITGRFEDARAILSTFKQYCRRGILPNRFPDQAGNEPLYNTVDATLWYFHAVLQYLKYTGDLNFIRNELWKTLNSIITHHIQGTLYGIGMDKDGLITHGPQLTWMDAVVDGTPVTPREGKAVEIQALWYNALRIMQLLAIKFNQEREAKRYAVMAERAR
ncbi:MAG: amylo-alpha-1,6-glucosidase, partial [Candidatus Freyarchaeota archaeon]